MEAKSIVYLTYSTFDLNDLKRMIIMNGVIPRTRSAAYAKAKEYRSLHCFVRVLKVDDSYFIISDKEDYADFWEFRKIAMRNERKKNNETL